MNARSRSRLQAAWSADWAEGARLLVRAPTGNACRWQWCSAGGKAGAAGRLRAARPSHPASALRGLDGQVGLDGSSPGGGIGGRRRRCILLLAAAPAVIGASAEPSMRLLAGWLSLSLAAVWLARRMWTLRSPLPRSLYVNMTSGPGGPAAPGGGRKENHQVRASRRGGGVAAGLGALRGHCTGRRPRRLRKFPRRALGRGPATPFVTCPAAEAAGIPAAGPSGTPRPSPDPHCSRAQTGLQTLGHLGLPSGPGLR